MFQVLRNLTKAYYKACQVLKSASSVKKCDRSLLQNVPGITKCDRLILQSVSGIGKCDRQLSQSASGIKTYDSAEWDVTHLSGFIMENEAFQQWLYMMANFVYISKKIRFELKHLFLKTELFFRIYSAFPQSTWTIDEGIGSLKEC